MHLNLNFNESLYQKPLLYLPANTFESHEIRNYTCSLYVNTEAPRATPSQLDKTSPPTLQSHFCDTLMTVLDLPLQEGTFEFGPTQSMTQNKFKAK